MTASPKSAAGDKNGKGTSELVAAATALDQMMARYEALIGESERASLATKKGIDRAARAIREAAETGAQMGAMVQTLATAIADASTRQQGRSEALLARSQEVQRRSLAHDALVDGMTLLSNEAATINERVKAFPASIDPSDRAGQRAFLEQVRALMTPVIDGARTLEKVATETAFPEIARQADALAQTLASARNKVDLAAKRLLDS